jgi:putative transposase
MSFGEAVALLNDERKFCRAVSHGGRDRLHHRLVRLADAPEKVPLFTRTLRLKVRSNSYKWLNAAAGEVNLVWNWCNEVSSKAAHPYHGPSRWLSGFDLNRLSTGAAALMERIGADTIQRVNCEYAAKRRQCRTSKLRWRVSRGTRRSLGWVPFKATSLRRAGCALRFCGKTIRVFEAKRLEDLRWRQGCFAQDAVGDWWLCLLVRVSKAEVSAPCPAVGIDLGLKSAACTSDGDRLDHGRFYRDLERKIAQAQRRGHRRQAKRLHRRAANRRRDALHKFSRKIVNRYQHIVVGDMSIIKLRKTRMAKAVLDSGLGMFKNFLEYKSQQAARSFSVVSEKNTSVACSSCGDLSGPRGVNGLIVRQWVCVRCGERHDRDVNAARNILRRAQAWAPVCGNKSSSNLSPSSNPLRAGLRQGM